MAKHINMVAIILLKSPLLSSGNNLFLSLCPARAYAKVKIKALTKLVVISNNNCGSSELLVLINCGNSAVKRSRLLDYLTPKVSFFGIDLNPMEYCYAAAIKTKRPYFSKWHNRYKQGIKLQGI